MSPERPRKPKRDPVKFPFGETFEGNLEDHLQGRNDDREPDGADSDDSDAGPSFGSSGSSTPLPPKNADLARRTMELRIEDIEGARESTRDAPSEAEGQPFDMFESHGDTPIVLREADSAPDHDADATVQPGYEVRDRRPSNQSLPPVRDTRRKRPPPGSNQTLPPGYEVKNTRGGPAPGSSQTLPPGYEVKNTRGGPAPGSNQTLPPGYEVKNTRGGPAPGSSQTLPPGYEVKNTRGGPAPGSNQTLPPGYEVKNTRGGPAPGSNQTLPPGYEVKNTRGGPAPGSNQTLPPGYEVKNTRGGPAPGSNQTLPPGYEVKNTRGGPAPGSNQTLPPGYEVRRETGRGPGGPPPAAPPLAPSPFDADEPTAAPGYMADRTASPDYGRAPLASPIPEPPSGPPMPAPPRALDDPFQSQPRSRQAPVGGNPAQRFDPLDPFGQHPETGRPAGTPPQGIPRPSPPNPQDPFASRQRPPGGTPARGMQRPQPGPPPMGTPPRGMQRPQPGQPAQPPMGTPPRGMQRPQPGQPGPPPMGTPPRGMQRPQPGQPGPPPMGTPPRGMQRPQPGQPGRPPMGTPPRGMQRPQPGQPGQPPMGTPPRGMQRPQPGQPGQPPMGTPPRGMPGPAAPNLQDPFASRQRPPGAPPRGMPARPPGGWESDLEASPLGEEAPELRQGEGLRPPRAAIDLFGSSEETPVPALYDSDDPDVVAGDSFDGEGRWGNESQTFAIEDSIDGVMPHRAHGDSRFDDSRDSMDSMAESMIPDSVDGDYGLIDDSGPDRPAPRFADDDDSDVDEDPTGLRKPTKKQQEAEAEEEARAGAVDRMVGLVTSDVLWILFSLGGALLGPILLYLAWDYYGIPAHERPGHVWDHLLRSGTGFGLWFGIGGAILFLLNLTYIARRRLGLLKKWISLRLWLNVHFLCGLTGASLILVHSALKFDNWVARVSSAAILIAIASGLFGRYVLIHMPRRVDGDSYDRADLAAALASLRRDLRQALAPYPPLRRVALEALEETQLEDEEPKGILYVGAMLLGDFKGRRRNRELESKLRAELSRLSQDQDLEPLIDETLELVQLSSRLNRRLSQFDAVQDLMETWRAIHMILALIMVVTMLLHVTIVLTYSRISWFG